MQIDWEAVHNLLPIYAYEYEASDDVYPDTESIAYWYPWEPHNIGREPAAGWTRIIRDEASSENLQKAVDDWLRTILRPNEKAVWLDMATGHFSNTFKLGDLLNSTLEALDLSKIGQDGLAMRASSWKLIVFRCEFDSDFEFTNMMKIVTKSREERKGK